MFDIFTREGIIQFLYTIPALLISLSIHEFAHALVAYKLGDISQKIRGRLSLDPLRHIDPVGFISIMLIGVGWGKPVMVDDRNFKDRAKGNMLTALAGPASNLVLAILITLLLKVLFYINPVVSFFGYNTIGNVLLKMLLYTVQFNIVFAVFNLIPLPPLDGSKVLTYFLPGRTKEIMYMLERYSFFIIMVIYFTHITSYIIQPAYAVILNFLNWLLLV